MLPVGCTQPAGDATDPESVTTPLERQLDSYDAQMTALAEMLKASDDVAAINEATRDQARNEILENTGHLMAVREAVKAAQAAQG
ncbi:MAG: hypothetical protein ACFE0O_07385 [Opitutales bacterium]